MHWLLSSYSNEEYFECNLQQPALPSCHSRRISISAFCLGPLPPVETRRVQESAWRLNGAWATASSKRSSPTAPHITSAHRLHQHAQFACIIPADPDLLDLTFCSIVSTMEEIAPEYDVVVLGTGAWLPRQQSQESNAPQA